MEKQRNPYFDALRGVAILMVVAIHTYNGATSLAEPAGCMAAAVRQLFNCAVPIFLAISGYFLSRKNMKTGGITSFWKRQLPRVYVPYLIWALPSLALALAGGRPLLSSLIFYFCCAFGVFYFVALIVQYYLLLPVLQRCATAWGVAVSALVSAVFIILMTWLTAVQGLSPLLLFRAGPFPVWLVFFVLGLYLGTHRRDYRLRWPLLCVVAGFVASCAETLWLNEQTGVPVVGIKLSAFCYAAAVIVFLFSGRAEQAAVRHGAWLQPLAWVGRLSYGVYLRIFWY